MDTTTSPRTTDQLTTIYQNLIRTYTTHRNNHHHSAASNAAADARWIGEQLIARGYTEQDLTNLQQQATSHEETHPMHGTTYTQTLPTGQQLKCWQYANVRRWYTSDNHIHVSLLEVPRLTGGHRYSVTITGITGSRFWFDTEQEALDEICQYFAAYHEMYLFV